ncbi:MAG: hypothetical protein N2Z69_03585 [Methylophilaceae bacterium]|nr:hypothetical protein [Methylophilaceae bacterium]
MTSYPHPAGRHARLPRLVPLPDGGILMSWVESVAGSERYRLRFAVLREGIWLEPRDVAEGEGWFVNWSDFPSVVAIDPKFWVAHWLVKRPGGEVYDYDIAMAYSVDSGQTWRMAGSPHRDGIAAEHGFVAIFPDQGMAGVVWLDGREYFEGKNKPPGISGHFALRYTTLNRSGEFSREEIIDDNTCTCCWPAAAVSSLGPVVAWRGRTEEEIRDIRLAIHRDGTWSPPMQLGGEGWKIAGCPVNGPALAARGERVVAAWFTAQGGRPRVRAAFSEDGGSKFGLPLEIDKEAPLGRIGVAWLDDTSAVISWMKAAKGGLSEVAVRRLFPDGRHGPELRVAQLSAGRDSGVPQLAVVNDGILLAWTGPAPEFGIHMAWMGRDRLKHAASSISWVTFSGWHTSLCG